MAQGSVSTQRALRRYAVVPTQKYKSAFRLSIPLKYFEFRNHFYPLFHLVVCEKRIGTKIFLCLWYILCPTVQYSLYLRICLSDSVKYKVSLIGNGIWHLFLADEQTKLKVLLQDQTSFALEIVIFHILCLENMQMLYVLLTNHVHNLLQV